LRTDIQAAFERDKSATAPTIPTAAGCLSERRFKIAVHRRSLSVICYGDARSQAIGKKFAMQLCTNARLLLDMVAASGQPKLWELTPPEARKKVIELARMVECEEAIGNIEDRTLPGEPNR
jgi:hypothetical protein